MASTSNPANPYPDSLIRQDDSRRYWECADPDVNGMLGGVPAVAGFSHISKVDLQGSRSFLAKLGVGGKNNRRGVTNALECGAGIGRVTEGLLGSVASHVDVIEPVSKFNDTLRNRNGVRHIFNVGLEEWSPEEAVQYELIWAQWCLGYLTDAQLVQFLKRCKEALDPNGGFIVVKENLSTSGLDIFDEVDSSVTRQDSKFRSVFTLAGLTIIKTELQKGLAHSSTKKLFPVRMYALKPREGGT